MMQLSTHVKREAFRIAIVVEELIVAGVSLCTVDLASALAEIGYDVTLIVLKKPELEVKWRERLCAIFFEAPIPLRILSELLQNFDAVMVSNGVTLPFGFEAARHTSKPLIVEWLHGEVKARQCPAVDFTIAVSEGILRSMRPSEHDVFIPNGVNLSRFRPGPQRCTDRVGLIQIAREWKTMKPDLAVLGPDLVDQGLPVVIHIVGKDGPSSDHVKYHGVERNVPSLLREADILLHMARMEPFGMPAIEAMASGVIPIVSNVGGLPDSVLDGITGYVVEFGDTPTVRKIVSELVLKIRAKHPDIVKVRERGAQRIKENFDILKTAGRIGRYIEEMAPRLPRRNRSASYPFSFIASVLYFVLDRKEQYLTAMVDVCNVRDFTEPMSNWKAFLSNVGPEWQQVTDEIWKFLDAVYSNLCRDVSNPAFQREAVCSFWLAFLALVLKRYDKLCDFLSRGDLRKERDPTRLPLSTIEVICFSLVISLLEMTGSEVSLAILLQARNYLKKCYYMNDFAALESWKLDHDLMQNLCRAARQPDLLQSLRTMEGASSR